MSEIPLQEIRERKPEAIAGAVRAHAGPLLRAALGLGLAPADAEELVQATFAAFLEAADRFEGRSSLRTYLFGILYNKALEQGRRRSKELAVDPGDQVFESRFDALGHWTSDLEGPGRELEAHEISELIALCLDGLPELQRAAFQLVDVDQESNREACNVLGVEDTHLRVLLFRARNRLRVCLEERWKGRP